MPSIAIRLDPDLLDDAALCVRYHLGEMLEERSSGLVLNDGYAFEEETDAMQIYLKAPDLDAALPFVIDFLETERLFGDALANAVKVGVSSVDAIGTTEFRIVFPEPAAGVISAP